MAVPIVSSIIFFLLFIIFSLSVDVSVFAAQMENRKLGGAKEKMSMRRNLEENGHQSPTKIAAHGSITRQGGSKTAKNEPSQTHPDKVTTAQKKKPYISYRAIQRRGRAICNRNIYGSCGKVSDYGRLGNSYSYNN